MLGPNWETKHVLSKNLRAGDRMEFLNRKTMGVVAHPIKSVEVEGKDVKVSFGGRMTGWATMFRARASVRIKRKTARQRKGER